MAYHHEPVNEFERALLPELEIEREFSLGRRVSPSRRSSASVFANLGQAQTWLETVSGFSRYRQEVGSLPPSEQARIGRVARLVIASHAPGQRPIVTIRLVGHADFDTPRRPAIERRISADRARSVQRALMTAIDHHALTGVPRPLARQLRWERFAMGATRPLYPAPRTDAERARNRRVDVLLEAVPIRGQRQVFRTIAAPAPQPACNQPSPAQSATVTSGGIAFDAQMVTTAFNPMPKGFIQRFVFAAKPSLQGLRFSCHRVEGRNDCLAFVIPAWAYDGAVSATLSATQAAGDFEFGFIQTVQRSRILHVYDGGAGRECVISASTRDALAGSPPPWMQSAAVSTLGSATPASIEDSPNTVATITHPTTPNLKLRQVCLEGSYLIWLAVRKKTASAAPVPLLFKEITVGRTWEFIQGRDPMDPDAWVAFGGQFESRSGDGNTKNRPSPKLNGPTANSQVATCFVPVTAKACQTEQQRQFLTNCIVGGQCGR
jgi:outer membrane protein OmpA-like peptidoglycan-associated protein